MAEPKIKIDEICDLCGQKMPVVVSIHPLYVDQPRVIHVCLDCLTSMYDAVDAFSQSYSVLNSISDWKFKHGK